MNLLITRHVRILCSDCFSDGDSFWLISFETDSELTLIEFNTFYHCFSLKSIIILRNVQFINGSPFSNVANDSFSITSENLPFVVPGVPPGHEHLNIDRIKLHFSMTFL
jgi:hypothetical protein